MDTLLILKADNPSSYCYIDFPELKGEMAVLQTSDKQIATFNLCWSNTNHSSRSQKVCSAFYTNFTLLYSKEFRNYFYYTGTKVTKLKIFLSLSFSRNINVRTLTEQTIYLYKSKKDEVDKRALRTLLQTSTLQTGTQCQAEMKPSYTTGSVGLHVDKDGITVKVQITQRGLRVLVRVLTNKTSLPKQG